MAVQDKTSAEEIQALRDDLKQLRGDFSELVSALKGEGGEKLEEWRDRVATTAHEKADAARRRVHSMEQSAGESAEQVRQAAEEHPFTTAVIALCLGLLTGAMLTGHKQ